MWIRRRAGGDWRHVETKVLSRANVWHSVRQRQKERRASTERHGAATERIKILPDFWGKETKTVGHFPFSCWTENERTTWHYFGVWQGLRIAHAEASSVVGWKNLKLGCNLTWLGLSGIRPREGVKYHQRTRLCKLNYFLYFSFVTLFKCISRLRMRIKQKRFIIFHFMYLCGLSGHLRLIKVYLPRRRGEGACGSDNGSDGTSRCLETGVSWGERTERLGWELLFFTLWERTTTHAEKWEPNAAQYIHTHTQ